MHTFSPFASSTSLLHRSLHALLTLLALLLPLGSMMIPVTLPSSAIESSRATLPLSFVPNVGQSEAAVLMQAYGLGGTLTFAASNMTLTLPTTGTDAPRPLRLSWEEANPQTSVSGMDRLPGLYHVYVGQATQWRSNIPTFAAVFYQSLYPGIDLRYDGQDGALKGTYLVAPAANPARIRWYYQGAQAITLDPATGNLTIRLSDGSQMVEDAPIAWQEVAGKRIPVEAKFELHEGGIHFALGTYDPQLPLVIDPTLRYSTFLGGNSTDYGTAIAANPDNSVVVTGQTYSTDFPGANGPRKGTTDVFVSKLNAEGNALLYTTILGGDNDDESWGLALDKDGNAWVTGETRSEDFPANALLYTYRGNGDTFVAKLGADGTLLRSGYLGLSVHDMGYAVAVDGQGNAYIAGEAAADYGPESFVKKIKADMSEVLYNAYFGTAKRGFDKGTSPRAIAVDRDGNAYVTGRTNAVLSETDDGGFQPFCSEFDGIDCTFDEAVVVKLNAEGNAIPHYTYLGGNGNDIGTGIALDKDGNILVTGYTFAANFPTKNALQPNKKGMDNFADAFVTKLTPQLNGLVYSTYLGGEEWEEGHSLVVDGEGNAYVAGMTNSPDDFPISADAPQPNLSGICITGSSSRYCYDGFVTKLTAEGALVWSTFLGGNDDDQVNGLALDSKGALYVVGSTESNGFPSTASAYQTSKGLQDDAFLVKLEATDEPAASATQLFLPLLQR